MKVAAGFSVFLLLSAFICCLQAKLIQIPVEGRLQRDFTDTEIIKVVKITGKLMYNGTSEKLGEFLQHLKRVVYKRRLAKCIKVFGSENICQNKANFYIWAQQMAKEIMTGTMA